MVKQGQFARRVQSKSGRQIQRTLINTPQQLINLDQVTDFLVTRYYLTRHRKLDTVSFDTTSRFLQVMCADQLENPWSLEASVKHTLQIIGNQVPWQFYREILMHWTQLQQFIVKEVPHLPIAKTPIVIETTINLVTMIGQQLAVNWYATLYATQPERLAAVTMDQITELTGAMISDEQIDWDKVATIYTTTPFLMPASVDEETQKWLGLLTQ